MADRDIEVAADLASMGRPANAPAFEVAGRLAPPPPDLVTADDVRAACLTLLRVGGPRDVAVRAVLDEFVDRLARRDVLLPHSPAV